MDDPFSSITPLSPRRDANHSRPSETPRRFQVDSTEIRMMSPPDSSEAKDKFATPPKAPVIAASSDEKTVILGRDTNLGFPEVGMTRKTVANSESGGSKVFKVKMPESEWGEFMAWKRRLASWERPLDERPLKQLVSDPNLDSPRAGAGVRYAEENMGKSMGDLKSSSLIHGFESPKNCLELNDSTEGKGLVSDDGIVKNVLESNDSTVGVAVLDSEEKGLLSGVGIAKNGQVVNDGSNAGRAEESQHSGEGSENGEYID